MLKKQITALLCVLFVSLYASNSYATWNNYVPDLKKIGSGTLSYLFWDIYIAELYAPKGLWSNKPPFALKLTYLRHIKGDDIADQTITEIRKQGFTNEILLAKWHTQLKKIFPNVDHNTTLIGVYTSDEQTIFYHNHSKIGTINDPLFSAYFFNIWLGDQTTAPILREQLLGTNDS